MLITIFYFIFRGELFTNSYSYVKLFDCDNWATYCSCDGKYLNYTFRKRVKKVELKLKEGESFVLFGYTGAGYCEIEPNTSISVDWKPLIAKKNYCSDIIHIDEYYKCYHLILRFT